VIVESQEQGGTEAEETQVEEKTDREEGGPSGGDGEAPEEGAEGTRPNPMPSHE
jgi:hypothetical protein